MLQCSEPVHLETTVYETLKFGDQVCFLEIKKIPNRNKPRKRGKRSVAKRLCDVQKKVAKDQMGDLTVPDIVQLDAPQEDPTGCPRISHDVSDMAYVPDASYNGTIGDNVPSSFLDGEPSTSTPFSSAIEVESGDFESLVVEYSDVIEPNNFPSGRVTCDMEFVFTQARQLEHHNFNCNFNGKLVFNKVYCQGLVYTYHFICNQKLCGHTEKIITDREGKSLNQLAVLGAMSIGNGFSQEEQRFSMTNMSYMNKNTYASCEKIAGMVIDAHTKEKLDAAINKEKALAEERGDVDKGGYYNICAIVDGGWCKCLDGHGYNA